MFLLFIQCLSTIHFQNFVVGWLLQHKLLFFLFPQALSPMRRQPLAPKQLRSLTLGPSTTKKLWRWSLGYTVENRNCFVLLSAVDGQTKFATLSLSVIVAKKFVVCTGKLSLCLVMLKDIVKQWSLVFNMLPNAAISALDWKNIYSLTRY